MAREMLQTIVLETTPGRYRLFEYHPRAAQIDRSLMLQIRQQLSILATDSWRLWLMSQLDTIEVGEAGVGAVIADGDIEVLVQDFRQNHILTAAFRRPNILPPPPTAAHPPGYSLKFARASTSVGAATKVVVFRYASENLDLVLRLFWVTLIGFALGLSLGLATARAERLEGVPTTVLFCADIGGVLGFPMPCHRLLRLAISGRVNVLILSCVTFMLI